MAGMEICMNKKKKKFVSYAKWGYIFLIPFFAVYIVFSLIPLISTFYNSFFENYMVGLMQVGPKFVGFDNYKAILFNGDTLLYLKNTMIMWLMGFIPQILISLLLASWFTDLRLRLKCTGFFKTIIYMPNLIMASAFAMLFYAIFADQGPINNMLNSIGLPTYRFLAEVAGARGLIALMNFLMWFGNTTIILTLKKPFVEITIRSDFFCNSRTISFKSVRINGSPPVMFVKYIGGNFLIVSKLISSSGVDGFL